jgi:chromate reductase
VRNKPAAVISSSTGVFGGVWAAAETRKVLGAMGGRVVEAELPVPHAHELLEGGRLALAPEQDERLDQVLAELVAAAEVESGLLAA